MANLTFTVKVDLVIGGRVFSPCNLGAVPGPGLREVMCLDEPGPGVTRSGDVAGFYLACWVGAGSQEFSLSRIADNGTADVALSLRQGDVDTLKFAVAMRMATPTTFRCSLLASNFIGRDELLKELSNPSRAKLGFTADQPSLVMCDNFTRNKAVVRFLDKGSDVKAYSKLALKPSSLLRLDESNAAVQRLGVSVEAMVGNVAVSPLNAGSQFVEGFTYGHMQNQLMHYATLGHVFKSMRSFVTLQQLMYNSYQSMHSTNLSFDALKAMSDAELVPRFGIAVVTRHTVCPGTSVYCADNTISVVGLASKVRETEDIAESGSRLNFEVQNAGKLKPYSAGEAEAPAQGPEGLAKAVRAIAESQAKVAAAGDAFASARISPTLDADDCENKALSEQMVAAALREVYRAHRTPQALCASMSREAKRTPGMFAACTEDHHRDMAAVLFRLGRMLDAGDWTLDLAVASAKGPSYSEDNPQAGEGLCGHGASIARVKDPATGLYQHYPVEGTAYLTVDMPPPKGYPTSLPLKLASGEVKTFPLETVATVLAQNMHELIGLSQHAQVLAHIRQDYGTNPLACPFYVSTFFTGLSEGKSGSLGCIPLDTCPAPMFRAGAKPLFGAPVMGLSNPATMAIPVTADMLAEDGSEAKGREMAELISAQVSEAWGPSLTEQALRNYFTYTQPVKSPDAPALTADNYAASIRSENAWFYDDPKVTRQAVQVYSALAQRFNELQAKDPASDGAVASAYGQYLSACLGISLPVPRSAAKFALSTAKNMRKAAEDIGLGAAIAACLMKSRMIHARASVQASEPFYMCNRGEGFVHSHRVKLALR